MTVKKLVVARGVSVNKKTGEAWDRVHYGLEVEIQDDNELLTAKAEAMGLISGWLSSELPLSRAPAERIPQIDTAEIESLPWKTFQTKEPCKPGQAGWTFRNAEGAEELVKALDHSGKAWTQIGDMEYQLSGRELGLITRRPAKS